MNKPKVVPSVVFGRRGGLALLKSLAAMFRMRATMAKAALFTFGGRDSQTFLSGS